MAIESVGLAGNSLVQSSAGSTVQADVSGRQEAQNAAVQSAQKASAVDTSRPVNAANAVQGAETEVEREQLEAAIEKLNDLMKESQRSLSFRVDEDLDKVVVTVTNSETDEVIRQMPTKESLEFAKNLEGVIGVIFNDHA